MVNMSTSYERPNGGEKELDPETTTSMRTRSVETGGAEKVLDETHIDIGWDLYQDALLIDPDEREVIAKRVKWKIDCYLLPMVVPIDLLAATTCAYLRRCALFIF